MSKSSPIQTESSSTKRVDTVKTLSEVNLTLLDARNEKAEVLLGKPDFKGQIKMGSSYYMVYYSKVRDDNAIKHLALFIDGKNGINEASPIYKIVAVNDGETINRAGNFAQWLKVSRSGLESNSGEFNYGKGSESWLDIEASGTGKVEPTGNVIGDTKTVNSLSELPIPKEAVKSDNSVKKYKVVGLSAREVYVFYATKFQAQFESNEVSEHKYLRMSYYDPTDSCILLEMTGGIDGSILLKFSFECDGNP